MRPLGVLLASLALVACASQRPTPQAGADPRVAVAGQEIDDASIASALARAGPNRPEIERYLARYANDGDPQRRLAARWLVANPPERGGYEETALQDPFDYAAEDTLVAWWQRATASFDALDLGYAELPGYGKSYAGPGTRNVRADTRI